MKKNSSPIVITALYVLFLASTAFAEDTADRYATEKDVPHILLTKAAHPMAEYKEQYISSLLQIIRQQGRTGVSLDLQDVEAMKDSQLHKQRHKLFTDIMQYDFNFDGNVTDAEIKKVMSLERSIIPQNPEFANQHIERQIKKLMENDTDRDGVLTREDIAAIPISDYRGIHNQQIKEFEDLVMLDPNKDGTLTINELEILGAKTFRTVDTNGDGTITKQERDALTGLRERNDGDREIFMRLSSCGHFPAPGDKDKIISLGAHEADTVTNVSLAGQGETTYIIPVHIEAGEDPLYIIASSHQPMIWQFTGATERISKVVLASIRKSGKEDGQAGGAYNVAAGATGIPAQKITFRDSRTCNLESTYKTHGRSGDPSVQQTLTYLTRRAPDFVISDYEPLSFKIAADGSTRMAKGVMEIRTAPEGFEQRAWERHLQYAPGGINFIKAENVVSDGKAEYYKVLPQWAGISKLLNDGALVATNNGMHIKKQIPHLPADLTGPLAVRFILGSDIEAPTGEMGHSCVFSEKTGKLTAGYPALCKPSINIE